MYTLIRKLGLFSSLIGFSFQFFLQNAFAINWSTLPSGIRMPNFKSDVQRVEFLQVIQKTFPGIFEVAAQYDINLLQIL